MNNSKFFAVLFILFISFSANAQLFGKYIGATLIMQDETEIDGYVKSNMKSKSKSVSFKEGLDSKSSEIDAEKIDYIVFSNGDGNYLAVKYMKWRKYVSKATKTKTQKKRIWVSVTETCKGIEVYEDFVAIKPKKDKVVMEFLGGGHNLYMQRDDEEEATLVCIAISSVGTPPLRLPGGAVKFSQQFMQKYFENDPTVLNIIGDGRITYDMISEAVQSVCN